MASQHPSSGAGQLFPLADQLSSLVLQFLAPSTSQFYNSTLSQFYDFLINLHPGYNPFPVNAGHVGLYVTHLFNKGLAGSTITSRVSALSFAYNLFKCQNPCDDYLVTRLLKTIRKLRPQTDARLPLTPAVLEGILANVHQLGFAYYDQILFKAMLSLAFAAFLRPGEMTGTVNNLQMHEVQVLGSTIMITFTKYKHSSGVPFIMYIEAKGQPSCPVKLLQEYLCLRGPYMGPLFVSLGGQPISYTSFKGMFQAAITWAGVRGRMSPHSIRIGAATHAAASGYPDSVIQKCGRWSSGAFKNYVRLPSVHL